MSEICLQCTSGTIIRGTELLLDNFATVAKSLSGIQGNLKVMLDPTAALARLQEFLNSADMIITDALDRLTQIIVTPGEILTAFGTYIILVKQTFIGKLLSYTGIQNTSLYQTVVGFLGKLERCFLLSLKNIPKDVLDTVKDALKNVISAVINDLIGLLEILKMAIEMIRNDLESNGVLANIGGAVQNIFENLFDFLTKSAKILIKVKMQLIKALIQVPLRISQATSVVPAKDLLNIVRNFATCVSTDNL